MKDDNQVILFPMPIEQVWEKFRELVRNELRNQEASRKAPVEYQVSGLVSKPLFKAHEVCEMMQISRQTLHAWVKEGLLKSYKIKSRVFFLSSDIEKLMQGENK